jgi:hypothetical protein
VRVLRRIARSRQRTMFVAHLAIRIGIPVVLVGLLARGCVDEHRPVRALELGHGLRPTATVDARRSGGDWESCDYERLTGVYDCDGLVTAYDATASLLNDAPPSWPFVTPAIVASAYTFDVEMRVRLRARVAGIYHVAVSEGTATLSVDGEPDREVDGKPIEYTDRGERVIELRAEVPITQWAFTFVREDTLIPDRPFLAGPPERPAFSD